MENQVKTIAQLKPSEIALDPRVEKQFVKNFNMVHGSSHGESIYAAEKFHFGKLVSESQQLQKCDALSLYGCFMDVAVQGLSFDPAKKLCYIVPMGNKATLMISGVGELYLRQRANQIKYADNPVVVYEGDSFKVTAENGVMNVQYEKAIPRKSDTIIASFIRIVRADDSVDFKIFSMEEILDLKKFSKMPNSMAWTTGLRGMVETKTIKHAFRNYPKVPLKTTRFTQLDTERIEKEEMDIYGAEITETPYAEVITETVEVKAEVKAESIKPNPVADLIKAPEKPNKDEDLY
jgi:recombinational DNA repair protein RecT